MAIKHTPIRTCIGTGDKKPKNEMIRLVRREDGSVCIDIKGKERGRGANLSMDVAAFDNAVKKKAINRALKLEKGLSAEQLAKLREDFIEAIAMKEFRQGNKPVKIVVSKEEFDGLNK